MKIKSSILLHYSALTGYIVEAGTALRMDHQRAEETNGQYGDVQNSTEIYRTVQKYIGQYRNI